VQVIKFAICLPMVGCSLRVFRILPPVKLIAMITQEIKSNPIMTRALQGRVRLVFV
jgi:hypothetical protein